MRRAAGRRAAGRRAAVLVVSFALACARGGDRPVVEAESAAATATATASSRVRESAAAPGAVAPSDTAAALDTVIVPPAPRPAAATDSTVPDAPPTPEELAALRAALVMPVDGIDPASLPRTFDEPRGGGTRVHEALDIAAPRGTPVRSAAAGRVLRLYTSDDGGLMVYAADPTDRFVLMYAHLDGYAAGLSDGAPLQAGQTIGYVGTTGNAQDNVPHLHFAIARVKNVSRWWTGVAVDPRPLLQPAPTPAP